MVTIIGEDPAEKHRVTCKNCSSVLEYVKADTKERHGTDYSGGPDGCIWVDCPKCGDKAIIKSW